MHESFELVFDRTDQALSGHSFKVIGTVRSEVPALSVVLGICSGGASKIPFEESLSTDISSAQRLQRAVGSALYGFSIECFKMMYYKPSRLDYGLIKVQTTKFGSYGVRFTGRISCEDPAHSSQQFQGHFHERYQIPRNFADHRDDGDFAYKYTRSAC